MPMTYSVAQIDGGKFSVMGGDGKTAHPCCAAHAEPHDSCNEANFCLWEYEMDNSQKREQAPEAEYDVPGVGKMKIAPESVCGFSGCANKTKMALFNGISPHGKHFCEAKHLSAKFMRMALPYVSSDDPKNCYEVIA